MSSIFTTTEHATAKDSLGNDINIPVHIQFVPGHCVEPVHSTDDLRQNGDASINTIIALPHIESPEVVFNNPTVAKEQYRYFPLLRTTHDVPSKGDPVLLCKIGKINYYLGPLNTIKNNPTWNDDINYNAEKIYDNQSLNVNREQSKRGPSGESLNFNKNNLYSRLIKRRKKELDFGDVLTETTGDYIIEGRHGNSLRVGSRGNNPYLFISNKRGVGDKVESMVDGSLISITSHGTLQQHFGGYELNGVELFGFNLSSDVGEDKTKKIGDVVSKINGGEQDAQQLIYNYGSQEETDSDGNTIFKGVTANQILLHSDRITLNTKLDDIYLSSIKDIHIGTGRHLTVSTNGDFIINSQSIILGNQENATEPMILGNTLLNLLKETLSIIKNSQGICQGAPIALADETGAPGKVNAKITKIEQKIDEILSTKYFIEPN